MEAFPDYEKPSIPVLGALNIARHIRNRRNGWKPELLGFRPLYDDRPGFTDADLAADSSSTGADYGTSDRYRSGVLIERPIDTAPWPTAGLSLEEIEFLGKRFDETDPNR